MGMVVDPRHRISGNGFRVDTSLQSAACDPNGGKFPALRAFVRFERVFVEPTEPLSEDLQHCNALHVDVHAIESQCITMNSIDASLGSSLAIVGDSLGDGGITLAVAAASQTILPANGTTGS